MRFNEALNLEQGRGKQEYSILNVLRLRQLVLLVGVMSNTGT
jgi:hypothetical protein